MAKKSFFPPIPRWERRVTVSEKIDGENVGIWIGLEDDTPLGAWHLYKWREKGGQLCCICATSRHEWLTIENDCHDFAEWVKKRGDQLKELGPGHHFGEWWGFKIHRQYDRLTRSFSLFNTGRWNKEGVNIPLCCRVVPVLWEGEMRNLSVAAIMNSLSESGSRAEPTFKDPEGIVIYLHSGKGQYYKRTFKNDKSK